MAGGLASVLSERAARQILDTSLHTQTVTVFVVQQ